MLNNGVAPSSSAGDRNEGVERREAAARKCWLTDGVEHMGELNESANWRSTTLHIHHEFPAATEGYLHPNALVAEFVSITTRIC
jgi:hypothetical protein